MAESSFFPDNVIILNAVSIPFGCHIITPGSTPDYLVPLFFREVGEEGNLVTVDYELPAALHLPDVLEHVSSSSSLALSYSTRCPYIR